MKNTPIAIYLNLILIVILLFVVDFTFVNSYIIGDITDYDILNNFKNYLLDNSKVFDEIYQSFINSLVLGEPLEGELKNDMIDIGVYHIMSLSGLHIGILYMVLNYILKFSKNKYLNFVIIAFVLIFYGCLTGLKIPTLRAIIMCIIASFGKVIGRSNNSLNTLSIASIIMILYNNEFIYSASFILSFVMVAGIIIYGKLLNNIFDALLYKYENIMKIVPYITLAISGFIVSMPLSLHFFGKVNILSIMSNIAIAFIVPIIFILGLFTLLSGVSIFVGLTSKFIDYILFIVEVVNKFNTKIISEDFSMIYVVITYILVYFILNLILNILKNKGGKYARENKNSNK
ncbi:MAG: ComEC/Rec2 family competence protein [Lachnospirales bacterium]